MSYENPEKEFVGLILTERQIIELRNLVRKRPAKIKSKEPTKKQLAQLKSLNQESKKIKGLK